MEPRPTVLARENRLTTSEGFRGTVRRGRRRGASTLVTHLDTPPGHSPPRAGFVVSKAVGTAVTRNRVQRRLRHLVRDRLVHLPSGGVLVVRALPRAAHATSADLAADLDRCLGSTLRGQR